MTYKVTMIELRNGREHTIVQECSAPDREAVIAWYGLREPDIVNYKIEEI